MTVDNNENLIINIGGKTQCIDKNNVKKMISAYFSAQGEIYYSYVVNNKSPETFCVQYNREQEESNLKTDITEPSYYNDYKITPIDFILANKIPFCEANIIKYICRWKNKNGAEDLQKAKEYIDILIKNIENG